ncbi:MAG: hypothetical protein KC636_00805 [Myxococcales bacterium]|nr:hypothetical protein [Myxococcales bacterium]
MEIYKSADNRSFNREDYLIEHIGPAHPSELDALGGPGSAKAALAKLWERGLNGLASHGCSKPGVPPFCHSVSLQTHTITVQELAAEFERIYDFKDACVVILVTLVGLTAPRCAPGDAGCGPIRFELPANECRPHDPSAPRTTVSLTEPHYPPYEEGACEHDGDCFLNGCGQYCHSWTTPGFGSTCEGSVSCAFCGCVAGRCRWFTEPSPANAP